jgi:hypothetical protein
MAGTVKAENAAYRYPQNNHGLRTVSLSIEVGERVLVGYIIFGALGGLLGGLTLKALRRAGFFAYLAEKK